MSRAAALPYAHLNLRRNPFGELAPAERAALAVVDVTGYLPLLERPRSALQFLGEAGRGKTTHLLALAARRPGPYVHFPEDGPQPAIPRAPLLYLDETQRLGWPAWARLLVRARVLVLGTHEDHTRRLRAAGFRVHTVHVGGPDVARLEALITRRIEAARRASGPVPTVPRDALRALVERFGDDLRAIEHHLYERIQALEEPRSVEV